MQQAIRMVLLLALVDTLSAVNAWADKPVQQPLFTIERSKNSNVVQYLSLIHI